MNGIKVKGGHGKDIPKRERFNLPLNKSEIPS